PLLLYSFSFAHTAPTPLYTLSLHDALPISDDSASRSGAAFLQASDAVPLHEFPHRPRAVRGVEVPAGGPMVQAFGHLSAQMLLQDRKSTRLNSSHVKISYAVFCLNKKKHFD